MENTDGTFQMNKMPSMLDIKPLEQLSEVKEAVNEPDEEVPVIEENTTIFVKPPTNKVKKKRVLSEKQKAHLEKLKKMRAEKYKLKLAEKEKQQLLKLKQKLEQEKKVENVKKAPSKPVVENKVIKQNKKDEMSNQEYMNTFFQNMEKFVSLSERLVKSKIGTKTTAPVKIPKKDPFKDMKQKPQKPIPPPKPKPTTINWLEPQANYNYKNPFGY
tara:strand:+ start:429 stop:1073 length:645 start_codon:yes stop_codon:yes gene_type:complete